LVFLFAAQLAPHFFIASLAPVTCAWTAFLSLARSDVISEAVETVSVEDEARWMPAGAGVTVLVDSRVSTDVLARFWYESGVFVPVSSALAPVSAIPSFLTRSGDDADGSVEGVMADMAST
jgi:hypothetical protein